MCMEYETFEDANRQQILIGLSVNVDISTSKVNNVYFLIFRVEYISENIFACFLTFLCKNNAKKQILFENWGIYCSIHA